MRILLGIGHPADVHLFRFLINNLVEDGHDVFVAAREKEVTCYLLDKFNITYHRVSFHQKAISKKLVNYFVRWVRTYRLCRTFSPDVALGVGDFYLPQIGRLQGFPSIVMTDTEKVRHDAVLTFPFATHILTPSCFKKNIGKKEINYHSYNELAYLIDKYFRPDPGIYNMLKINTNERYMIVRYVSHSAVHDIGVKGMSIETKIKAVQEFSKYVKVFVSSETELPDALKPYRIPIPPERMHHALFYAELLYGESATMSSECAVLGTPAVSIDDVGRGYTDEQEKKYGLVFNFSTSRAEQEKSIHKSIELLKRSDLKTESKCKRETMLAEKIDLTSFLVWFVENYPESVKTMKDTPDYQQRFK